MVVVVIMMDLSEVFLWYMEAERRADEVNGAFLQIYRHLLNSLSSVVLWLCHFWPRTLRIVFRTKSKKRPITKHH